MNETWPLTEYSKDACLQALPAISQVGRQRRVNVTETACLSTTKSMETSTNTTRERGKHIKKSAGDLWRICFWVSVDNNVVITVSVSLSFSKQCIPEVSTPVSYTRIWETLHGRPFMIDPPPIAFGDHCTHTHACTHTYTHERAGASMPQTDEHCRGGFLQTF